MTGSKGFSEDSTRILNQVIDKMRGGRKLSNKCWVESSFVAPQRNDCSLVLYRRPAYRGGESVQIGKQSGQPGGALVKRTAKGRRLIG